QGCYLHFIGRTAVALLCYLIDNVGVLGFPFPAFCGCWSLFPSPYHYCFCMMASRWPEPGATLSMTVRSLLAGRPTPTVSHYTPQSIDWLSRLSFGRYFPLTFLMCYQLTTLIQFISRYTMTVCYWTATDLLRMTTLTDSTCG